MTLDTSVPEVQWDTERDEPFIVPASHPHVRLTPYRDEAADIDALAELSSAPEVGKWSHRRPYPCSATDARGMITKFLPEQEGAVAALQAARDSGNPSQLNYCPFTVIRVEGRYVGDLGVWVRPDDECDEDRHGRPQDQTLWGVGYALDPRYWGRGLASAAVRAALAWSHANMGVNYVEARAETANYASGRVLTKLGFANTRTLTVPWTEAAGGGVREVGVWSLSL